MIVTNRRDHRVIDGVARTADLLEICDPATGALVGRLPMASAAEVRDAVRRARAALPDWRRASVASRGAGLLAAADALGERAAGLAELHHRETGSPLGAARAEVTLAIATLRRFAELGSLRHEATLRDRHRIDCSVPEPHGVAVVVTPWNEPVAAAAGLIAAALVTGNTVVHKPSERCPHLGLLLGSVLGGCLPDGVLGTVLGDGRSGALLAADTDVDVVAHTGSSFTAQAIAMAAALSGAHVVSTPHGSESLLVDAGVDPDWAAERAAAAGFTRAGRERIYLHRGIADAFLDALTTRARDLNASGAAPPLVDQRLRETVAGQVHRALAAGARCLEGGEVPDGPGAFYPATVLTDCTPEMEVMAEQALGPVAPAMVVDTFDGALHAAAVRHPWPTATVLTGDLDHVQHAMVDLPAHTLRVNPSEVDGQRAVSIGARWAGNPLPYGPELLDEFTRLKVVQWAVPHH